MLFHLIKSTEGEDEEENESNTKKSNDCKNKIMIKQFSRTDSKLSQKSK